MDKIVYVKGYCPHLKTQNSIEVTRMEVPMCGTTKKKYKTVQFDCSYSNECTLDFECPLIKLAK